MVQTRSGTKVGDEGQVKNTNCHHGRNYPLNQEGLWCSKCGNFYCDKCLKNIYHVNELDQSSPWLCFQCLGRCLCDTCQKPTQPTRPRKPKKKTKESHAEIRLKKELELKDACIMQLKTTIEEGRILLCKVSEALTALASAPSVSREREEFLKLVNEINLYHSMMDKEGIDGEQDIMKAYKAAHEEIDEHVSDGASSALTNKVDAMQQKLIDDIYAKIGDDWPVLDRDYDGKVTSASATAAYLKDVMAKDKATSEEENQKPTGESSSCVLDDEEEHSPLVFKAVESFYSVLDNEQKKQMATIKSVKARQIFDGGGNPTVEDFKRVEDELRICRSDLHAAEEANKQKVEKIRRLEEGLKQAEARVAAAESRLESELSSMRKFLIKCHDAANEAVDKVANVQVAAEDVWKDTFTSWRI